VSTIYATESLFESVDETFAQLKEYVVGAVGQAELHHVEQELFRRVQQVGRALLETFITVSGSGYQADHPPLTEDGEPMRYKGAAPSPYVSIFGEINILRAAYAHPRGGRVYPLDTQLNLPQHQFSYLLLKWLQAGSAEQDFRTAVNRFNEIFDFSFFPELPQRQGLPIAAYVEPFYQQVETPPAATEGSHIALSADGKGVRILQSERPQPSGEEALAKPRLGKGEKPGIKKEAVVVTDFSFHPQSRTAESIVKGLLNQYTRQEKKQATLDRQDRRQQGLPEPRAPHNKHVFATLAGKDAAFEHLLHHLQRRDPTGQKPLIALLDGDPALENTLSEQLRRYDLQDHLKATILDITHASEYLWEVGTALHGEKGPARVLWVEEKLYALLEGKVGYVIGGLRQRCTKNQAHLTLAQHKTLEKTITYFDNHRHMMEYHTYLKNGYPISTGVVEGACGSLVKNRMEQSGMRWSVAGAQAVLNQRAVVKNGDWEDFWRFYIDAERERLYPTIYEKAA